MPGVWDRTGSRPDLRFCPWGAAERDLGANTVLCVYSGASSLELLRKQLCESRENMWDRPLQPMWLPPHKLLPQGNEG